MNTYEIVITPDAEADLHQICDYIAYGIDARKIVQTGRVRHHGAGWNAHNSRPTE